ncbi:MAG: C10 family peptidase [Bacteroidales bacterium]|nr:C10 family peptidase [Bacteroidales bacterium]
MKKLVVLLTIMVIAFNAMAERVSYKDAEKAAKAYYYQTVNAFRATEWNDIDLTCVVNPNDANPKYNLYIFDVNGDEGYIVVSSDDQIMPVLAYSFESSFNMHNMSPGQAAYLNYYSESNDNANKADAEMVEMNHVEWNYLLTYDPQTRATREVVTSPILLDGIVWEQGWPFNSMCPTKTGGDSSFHGHAPVGCVATATCHVMKYWNWPASGSGSYTHSNYSNGGCGNITVNFASQTYDWNSMLDDPTKDENEEIGKICFHVGVAVKMHWAADGSGAQTWDVPTALKTYFNYASDVRYASRGGGWFSSESYSDAEWHSLLRSQIDQRYPMVYSGSSTEVGHAWNCDGYQINGTTEKFHMQWGWGAAAGNGFYTLDNLHSTAIAGGEENNFISNQEVVINIHPNQDLSACQSMTIRGTEGSFDDGSRAYNYSANKDCVYVINPECGAYITVNFSKFDLADGDYLDVFAGDETSTDLIATYDNSNLPNESIKTPMGAVTLKFHTDGQGEADGWRLSYKSIYCNSMAVKLYNPSGSFGDGSKSCQYQDNANCQWKIMPEGAAQITISFQNFNLANDGEDYVALYKKSNTNSNLVVKYNSNNIPREPITIPEGVVVVKFFSNINEVVGDGWVLSYTSSDVLSVDDVEIMSNLSVIPNPANEDAKIAFTLTDASNTTITITNLLGQVVGQQDFNLESGYHEISFENFSNLSLQNQIYFVTLQNRNQIKTCKFLFAE